MRGVNVTSRSKLQCINRPRPAHPRGAFAQDLIYTRPMEPEGAMPRYRALQAELIVETARRLDAQLQERFSGSGLSRVSLEFLEIAEETGAKSERLSRPLWGLRVSVAIVAGAILLGPPSVLLWMGFPLELASGGDAAQILDTALNVLVLVGGAVLFLVTVEIRVQRRRIVRAVHELRVLAHVIDMHQLTKDPVRLSDALPTASSPEEMLTPFELLRYLDYCSEMLAVLGKLAALYAQRVDDRVVLSAVDAVESLTTGISRKIWQKMTIIHTLVPESIE